MLEVALNLWKGVLLEKMTVAQLVNTYPPSVNREVNYIAHKIPPVVRNLSTLN
jgi:hypothetical protein